MSERFVALEGKGIKADGETLLWASECLPFIADLEQQLAAAQQAQWEAEAEHDEWQLAVERSQAAADFQFKRAEAAEQERDGLKYGWIAAESVGEYKRQIAEIESARDAALADLTRAREALERIKREYGQVCEEFEICTHVACTASYSAWAEADLALAALEARAAPR